MGSNEQLTAAEWYDFLINEVKMPSAARDELEKLAQALEHHFMTKDLFANLSEDNLVSSISLECIIFKFENEGIVRQLIILFV
jgi:hypothetical protein